MTHRLLYTRKALALNRKKKEKSIWVFRQTGYTIYKRKKISLFIMLLDNNNILKIFKQGKLSQYLIFTQTGQR